MDILSMLRTLGALGMVLGMLAGALWFVKRYDVKLPGRVTNARRKRLEIVERLSVDAKRSVALIRRDGMEHLVMYGPEGQSTIETGIAAPESVEAEPAKAPDPVANLAEDLAALRSNFASLVELPRKMELRAAPRRAPTIVAAAQPAPRLAKRVREQRNTTRWNRAAVRAALDA
jgi:flagellar biogenesis protein FliO